MEGDLLHKDLVRRLALASRDELRVIDRVLGRLELGRQRYGTLDLAGDRRDWRAERFEERLDALVYDVCDELVLEEAAQRELREFAPDQHLTRVTDESARIAAADVDHDDPYEEWTLGDSEGGGA